jgi:hypothetical protein
LGGMGWNGITFTLTSHLRLFFSFSLPIRTGTSLSHAGAERHPLRSNQVGSQILPGINAEKTVIDASCPPTQHRECRSVPQSSCPHHLTMPSQLQHTTHSHPYAKAFASSIASHPSLPPFQRPPRLVTGEPPSHHVILREHVALAFGSQVGRVGRARPTGRGRGSARQGGDQECG